MTTRLVTAYAHLHSANGVPAAHALRERTCNYVVGFLDRLESVIETRAFKEHFGAMRADRGIEFGNFHAIKKSRLANGRRY